MDRPFLPADNRQWFMCYGRLGYLEYPLAPGTAGYGQAILWHMPNGIRSNYWEYVSPFMVMPFPMHRTLVLVRGLPGAGKSMYARRMVYECVTGQRQTAIHWEADLFMHDADGHYRFDPAHLSEAHAQCQDGTRDAMRQHANVVIVSNTFTQRWEMEPYFIMAATHGYIVHVVDLYDATLSDEQLAARNQHQVPVATIAKMRARWEAFA